MNTEDILIITFGAVIESLLVMIIIGSCICMCIQSKMYRNRMRSLKEKLHMELQGKLASFQLAEVDGVLMNMVTLKLERYQHKDVCKAMEKVFIELAGDLQEFDFYVLTRNTLPEAVLLYRQEFRTPRRGALLDARVPIESP